MFCIGNVSEEKKRLVQVTKECLYKGLAEVKPWGFLGDMGQAVHDHAFANGYTIVREIGGHGIGLDFHEEPWVGYNSKRGTEMLLVPGQWSIWENRTSILMKTITGRSIRTMDFPALNGRFRYLSQKTVPK